MRTAILFLLAACAVEPAAQDIEPQVADPSEDATAEPGYEDSCCDMPASTEEEEEPADPGAPGDQSDAGYQFASASLDGSVGGVVVEGSAVVAAEWTPTGSGELFVGSEEFFSHEEYEGTADADLGMFIMRWFDFDPAVFEVGQRTLTWEDGFAFTLCAGTDASLEQEAEVDEGEVDVTPLEDGSREIRISVHSGSDHQVVTFRLTGEFDLMD